MYLFRFAARASICVATSGYSSLPAPEEPRGKSSARPVEPAARLYAHVIVNATCDPRRLIEV
jgi:hypothetical protein